MILLQIWGGTFYLINKILFSLAEAGQGKGERLLKLWGWGIYILGVPAWVIILLSDRNWIAASLEAGAIPSMLLGFYTVFKMSRNSPEILEKITSFITYGAIVLGVAYSLYVNDGIRSMAQVLEMGATIGFLWGSFLLARNMKKGWLFFMLMNGCMGSLMLLQHKPLLALQQIVSLCFVLYGLMVSIKNKNDDSAAAPSL